MGKDMGLNQKNYPSNVEFKFDNDYIIEDQGLNPSQQILKNDNIQSNSTQNNKLIKKQQIVGSLNQKKSDIPDNSHIIKQLNDSFNNLQNSLYQQEIIKAQNINPQLNFEQTVQKNIIQIQNKILEKENQIIKQEQVPKKNKNNAKKNLTKNYSKLIYSICPHLFKQNNISLKTIGQSINHIKMMLLQNRTILETLQQFISKQKIKVLHIIMQLKISDEDKLEMLLKIKSFIQGIKKPENLYFWDQEKASKYTDFSHLIQEEINQQEILKKVKQEFANKYDHFKGNLSSLKNNKTHHWLKILKTMIKQFKTSNFNIEAKENNQKLEAINCILSNQQINHKIRTQFIQNQQLLK